jgi:hypothetical protein
MVAVERKIPGNGKGEKLCWREEVLPSDRSRSLYPNDLVLDSTAVSTEKFIPL